MNNDSDDINAGNINDLIQNIESKKPMSTFVKNVEGGLENLQTFKMDENFKRYNQKQHINKLPPTIKNQQMYINNINLPQKKDTIFNAIINNSKLVLSIAILFVLLAHPKLTYFIDKYIPYLQNTFFNLLFRGLFMGIIIFLLKKPLKL
jgi:hypothetical protein